MLSMYIQSYVCVHAHFLFCPWVIHCTKGQRTLEKLIQTALRFWLEPDHERHAVSAMTLFNEKPHIGSERSYEPGERSPSKS